MTKKFIRITSLLLVLVFLVSCSPSSEKKELGKVEESKTTEISDVEKNTTEAEKEVAGSLFETVENTLLFEQDGIKVTAVEIVDEDIWGKGLKVLIENNSDIDIKLYLESLVINDYMISDLFSAEVASGKKTNEVINLVSSELKESGINKVAKIDMAFRATKEDWSELFITDLITLKTSEFEKYKQVKLDEGLELLNQDGIRIVGKYVSEDTIWGAGVVFFIENNSGQNITLRASDVSINGFMVDAIFSADVLDGKMILDDMSIFKSSLEDNNIEKIEQIELKFKIINPENYNTILETEPIGITMN